MANLVLQVLKFDRRLSAGSGGLRRGNWIAPIPSSSLATEGDRDTAAALVDAARMSERSGSEPRHGSSINSVGSEEWRLSVSTFLIACSMASCSRAMSDSASLGKVCNCTTIDD